MSGGGGGGGVGRRAIEKYLYSPEIDVIIFDF